MIFFEFSESENGIPPLPFQFFEFSEAKYESSSKLLLLLEFHTQVKTPSDFRKFKNCKERGKILFSESEKPKNIIFDRFFQLSEALEWDLFIITLS